MNQQYWVIGGEYRDLDFAELIEGTSQVEGPFNSYEAAHRVWRDRTVASKSEACRRYTIACHASDPRRQQIAA